MVEKGTTQISAVQVGFFKAGKLDGDMAQVCLAQVGVEQFCVVKAVRKAVKPLRREKQTGYASIRSNLYSLTLRLAALKAMPIKNIGLRRLKKATG